MYIHSYYTIVLQVCILYYFCTSTAVYAWFMFPICTVVTCSHKKSTGVKSHVFICLYYIYIHMCFIYTYVCFEIQTKQYLLYVYTYLHSRAQTYIYMYMYIDIYVYIFIYIYLFICVYVNMCIYIHMFVCSCSCISMY